MLKNGSKMLIGFAVENGQQNPFPFFPSVNLS